MTLVEDLKYIPFEVRQEDAKDIIKQWVHSKSIDFENLVATYIPCWFVSCNVIVASGTQLRQVTIVDGMLFEQQIEERYVIRERTQMDFRNIPYLAVSEGQAMVMEAIGSFDNTTGRSMVPEDLVGIEIDTCEAEETQIQTWLEDVVPRSIDAFLKERYQAYEEVVVELEALEISQVTLRQFLVPVWHMRYQHRNKAYTVWINGQTGQVGGERPLGIRRFFLWRYTQKVKDWILPYLDQENMVTLMHTEEDKGAQVTLVAK
ncbi:MAG: hypothetical protein ACRCW2_02935 [Cellulosilyticaceae bacterium]